MASITFSVNMTDGTTMNKVVEVTDQDVGRLLQAFATKYQAQEGVSQDGPFLVGKWIEDTVVTALNFVKQVEQAQAASVAVASVELIPFTIS